MTMPFFMYMANASSSSGQFRSHDAAATIERRRLVAVRAFRGGEEFDRRTHTFQSFPDELASGVVRMKKTCSSS
eukprot:jgi/Pico_ML_1/52683/g3356.t1